MSVPSDFDALLTVDEVASQLGCSTRTVRRLAASGDLPGLRLRNLRRWRRSDVAAYLAGLGTPGAEAGADRADVVPFVPPGMTFDAAAVSRVFGFDNTDLLMGAVSAGLFPLADDLDAGPPLWRAAAVFDWLAADGMAALFASKPRWIAATAELHVAWDSGCVMCGSEAAGAVVVRPNAAGLPSSVHAVCSAHASEIESDAWNDSIIGWYAARGMDVRVPEAVGPEGGDA